jgi:hypothetical protein
MAQTYFASARAANPSRNRFDQTVVSEVIERLRVRLPRAYEKRYVIVLAVAVVLAALPSVAGATVHGCPYVQGLDPRNEQSPGFTGVSHVSVHDMRCSAADRAIRNGYLVFNSTQAIPYTLRTHEFACKPLTGGAGGATIRCTHGSRAFRFTYGT